MTILLPTCAGRLPLRQALGPLWLMRVAPLALLHLAAVAIMLWSEINVLSMAVFALAWGFVNGLWLVLLRRPVLAAALSLVLFAVLIMVSRFKFDVLWMSLSFIDVMVIDADTFAFLMMMFPNVRTASIVVALIFVPLAVAAWRLDPFRVHRGAAVLGSAACFGVIAGLSLANPVSPGEAFGDFNYVSHFTRTGIDAVGAYFEQGFLESDPAAVEELRPETACENAGKRPHIILVHDESSFDIRAVEGVKVPPGYGQQFRSFDGKARKLLVEGAGGPSWYTEYNVLSGLSSRSYGRFQFFVTRIAAGRVERGLPRALQRCGYRTHAIYPVNGGFLGASSYYKGVGIEDFVDGKALGSHVFEPDQFYFDAALRMIESDRRQGPMFLYVYLTANHFTWDYQFHPELTPAGWRDPGNATPEVNEYPGRQATASAAIPYVWGTVRGTVFEQQQEVTRSGLGDLRLRIAANIIGSPALSPQEFATRKPTTVVGASLSIVAPTGQYDPRRLVNLGSNRWAFKPELGLTHPIGDWTLELIGGVWLFTDNDNFFGGSLREQKPLASFQGHVTYTIRPRMWVAANGTYYTGGRTVLNGRLNADLQNNSRVGATFSYPVSQKHSIKVSWAKGVLARIGGSLNTIAVGYQYTWF